MKKKFRIMFYALSLCLVLSSCGMQKFSIGDTTGQTVSQDKRKCVMLFWGLLPIGRKQTFPAVADAKGYVITTRHNAVDFIVTGITGGIVGLKTVKFEATK
jgi:hypothetical protein